MKDNYRQHFPRDDALIRSEMLRFSRMATERGLNAANTEVISRLIANVYGTREAYDLFQSIADNLLEYGRDVRTSVGEQPPA
jgi:hypothetical protein